MTLEIDKEYQFIGNPQTTIKIVEAYKLGKTSIYMRYIQTDTKLNESYEDSRVIKLDMIDQVFEESKSTEK